MDALPSLPRLPRHCCLPINRCNLPAAILGGLTFQRQPTALMIDGVAELHHDLYRRLAALAAAPQRVTQFVDYLDVHFKLREPEAVGYQRGGRGRPKATWQRMLRGWLFDTDSREGAVLKGWVESRFGLLPRYHGGPIRDFSAATYRAYLEARAQGLYNTNALEAQLDLVYSFCQFELLQTRCTHLTLYRGINGLAQMEWLPGGSAEQPVMVLNNLNSFSRDPERASEFGDRVAAVRVPCAKVFCFDTLFPALFNGEGEYLVIGGLYELDHWLY